MKSLPAVSRTLTVAAVCGLFRRGRFRAANSDQQRQPHDCHYGDGFGQHLADTACACGLCGLRTGSQAAYAAGSRSRMQSSARDCEGCCEGRNSSESQSVAETQHYELEKLPPAEQAQRRFHVRQSGLSRPRGTKRQGY